MSARSVARLITLVIIFASIALYLLSVDSNTCSGAEIKYKNFSYCASVADDLNERSKGLSGRIDIPEDEAMLFIFNVDDYHGIWMKDMKISIDVVWLDSNKVVTKIIRSMQPSSYPNIFYPDIKSRYVIEFAEGSIDRNGLVVGDKLYW